MSEKISLDSSGIEMKWKREYVPEVQLGTYSLLVFC